MYKPRLEAFQVTKYSRRDNTQWPNWLKLAWNLPSEAIGSVSSEDYPKSKGDSKDEDRLVIHTLEGVYTISWGDWILKDVAGKIYPVKYDWKPYYVSKEEWRCS